MYGTSLTGAITRSFCCSLAKIKGGGFTGRFDKVLYVHSENSGKRIRDMIDMVEHLMILFSVPRQSRLLRKKLIAASFCTLAISITNTAYAGYYTYENSPCEKTQYQFMASRTTTDDQHPAPAFPAWIITEHGFSLAPKEGSFGTMYAVRVYHAFWNGYIWEIQGGTGTDGSWFWKLGEGEEKGIYATDFGECSDFNPQNNLGPPTCDPTKRCCP